MCSGKVHSVLVFTIANIYSLSANKFKNMSSPSAEPSSTCRLPHAVPNRHGNFGEEELQDIFLTVEQSLPSASGQDDNNYYEDIRWDLGNPEEFVVHRRENEGTRPLFDVPDVMANAILYEPEPRLERGTSLRPSSRRRGPSEDSRRRTRSRSPVRYSRRNRSPTRSSTRSSYSPPRYRRNYSREKRRRSPSRSSYSSCEGCDDPDCGKEYIVLTDEIKRCLMEHPVLGKGLFIRDPSRDAQALYIPKPGENLMYPNPITYDVGSTNAMFLPFFGDNLRGNRGFQNNNRGRRGRGRKRMRGNRRFNRSMRCNY